MGNTPFLTPLFLLGAATAAIPVILHMIYRVRAPKLLFSTLRFLKLAADKTAHRRRIQNWLLLLLRMLLFAGLAVGLGNLVGCQDTRAMLGAGKKTAAVLVVDNSFSMRMRLPKGAGEQVAAGTRYQRAKAFAAEILARRDELGLTKLALVVTCAPPQFTPAGGAAVGTTENRPALQPRALVGLQEDTDALKKDLQRLDVTYGRADLIGAMRLAYGLIEAETEGSGEIYLLTDLQKTNVSQLANLSVSETQRSVPVYFCDCGSKEAVNFAITAVTAGGIGGLVGMPVDIEATVRNFSRGEPDKTVQLILRSLDDPAAPPILTRSQAVRFGAAHSGGDVRAVQFQHRFERGGLFEGLLLLDGNDDLAEDDMRVAAIHIRDKVPALLVRDDGDPDGDLSAAHFLLSALNLFEGGEAGKWPIAARQIRAARLTAEQLLAADICFLVDVSTLTDAQCSALGEFVREGGTLVTFLGPRCNVQTYNSRLFEKHRLLPLKLTDAVGDAASLSTAFRIKDVNDEHPLLAGLFAADDFTAYEEVVTYRFMRTEVTASPGLRRPLSLEALGADGKPRWFPLLADRSLGEGRTVLFTTTAHTAWSTLPRSDIFLPLIVRLCVGSVEGTRLADEYAPGGRIDIHLPRHEQPLAVEIAAPPAYAAGTKSMTTDPARGRRSVSYLTTATPGIYRVTVAEMPSASTAFPINADARESDPTVSRPWALNMIAHKQVVTSAAQLATARTRNDPPLSLRELVLALVVLLALFECHISNRLRSRPADLAAAISAAPPPEQPAEQ